MDGRFKEWWWIPLLLVVAGGLLVRRGWLRLVGAVRSIWR